MAGSFSLRDFNGVLPEFGGRVVVDNFTLAVRNAQVAYSCFFLTHCHTGARAPRELPPSAPD
jgi:hypothetical protein